MMNILKWGDFVAFATSVIVIVLLSIAAYGGGADNSPQVIIDSSQGQWIYPLGETLEVAIPGELGETMIHIHDGLVDVIDSPCRDKICVHAQDLEAPGDWTACLPNNVFIKIAGQVKREDSIDDIGF